MMMERSRALEAQQRRTKRLVPDTDKDEAYWEKRKRNNVAAKKSRESKRQYECLVKSRVHALEEENTLLKKELEVIKERFNIPKDVCVLSQSERDECVDACWKAQGASIHSPKTGHETPNVSLNMSEISSFKYDDYGDIRTEVTEESLVDSRKQVSNFIWAVTPAHSQSLQRYAEGSRIYRNEISYDQTSGCPGSSLSKKRKRDAVSHDDNMAPADLSIKRNPNACVENTRDDSREIERNPETKYDLVPEHCVQDRTIKSPTLSLRNTPSPAHPVDYSSCDSHENCVGFDSTENGDMINSDIKNKLQLLSDQVERMQKLVCRTTSA